MVLLPGVDLGDYDFHIAQYFTSCLKHVSPLTTIKYACNILLRMLPIRNHSNDIECLKVKNVIRGIQ